MKRVIAHLIKLETAFTTGNLPETQSTTTKAPSVTRNAAVT